MRVDAIGEILAWTGLAHELMGAHSDARSSYEDALGPEAA